MLFPGPAEPARAFSALAGVFPCPTWRIVPGGQIYRPGVDPGRFPRLGGSRRGRGCLTGCCAVIGARVRWWRPLDLFVWTTGRAAILIFFGDCYVSRVFHAMLHDARAKLVAVGPGCCLVLVGAARPQGIVALCFRVSRVIYETR